VSFAAPRLGTENATFAQGQSAHHA